MPQYTCQKWPGRVQRVHGLVCLGLLCLKADLRGQPTLGKKQVVEDKNMHGIDADGQSRLHSVSPSPQRFANKQFTQAKL
jgi:hypothetical protein